MAENDDAVITYSTDIHYSETEEGDYKKLFDAKDYPDDSEAEELDITTLSDPAFRSIPGIDANEARPYTANYTKAKYDELKSLEGKLLYFMEIFGPDGVDGKFKFSGRLKVRRLGKGVNEVREMEIKIFPNSQITTSE